MSVSYAAKMKFNQLEGFVVDFVTSQRGHFLVVSEDHNFQVVLRGTLVKQLGITEDCVTIVGNPDYILKVITETQVRKKGIVVFIERLFQGKDMGFLVRQIKNAFSSVKIIILTGETDRQRLVLLHEIGADNFIAKPISINTLIEKMAFTIKPQGKLGQLIDLAKSMIDRESYDQALKAGRKILELKPNSAAGLLILGDAYSGLQKFDKAHESYEQASQNAEMYLDPLKKLVALHQKTGNQQAQLQYLKRLDSLSPLNVERKVDMGQIHVDLGNEEEAEELFEAAMTQARKEAYAYIGEISEKIGHVFAKRDPERAERYYRQALETKGDLLERSDIATFNRLGIALRKQGKWLEATQEYRKAVEIAPDDENLFYNMAMACAEGKDFQAASEHLTQALAINPQLGQRDKTLAYNMGAIFLQSGSMEKARSLLEISLKIDPRFVKAQEMLKKVTG